MKKQLKGAQLIYDDFFQQLLEDKRYGVVYFHSRSGFSRKAIHSVAEHYGFPHETLKNEPPPDGPLYRFSPN